MIPFSIQEIEQSRAETFLYRALMAIRTALNKMVETDACGVARLTEGRVTVYYPGLALTSEITPSYRVRRGVVGILSVDPADYNISTHTFVIRSSSVNDTSDVNWRHWL